MLYQLGSTANISCFSKFAVEYMQWFHGRNMSYSLANATRSQYLELNIDRVTQSINNTLFTCEVVIRLSSGMAVNYSASFFMNVSG